MRRTVFVTSIWLTAAAMLSAQAPVTPGAVAPATLNLTVDDAVKMALDHNPDLSAARIDPQIGDTQVAAAVGAFRPVFNTGFQQNNQLQPPSSFLIPTATRNDATTSSVGLAQKLPWYGTTYSMSWNAVRTDSNSILTSYNPLVQSGLALSVSQPLIRDLSIDNARQQVSTSRNDRDIAGTRMRETLVQTTANVKRAYWGLVTAIAKVDVGQSPPLDLVAAEAEVAADKEQVIIAETAVKVVEDQLRTLIFDTSDRSVWSVKVDPIDSPPV